MPTKRPINNTKGHMLILPFNEGTNKARRNKATNTLNAIIKVSLPESLKPVKHK